MLVTTLGGRPALRSVHEVPVPFCASVVAKSLLLLVPAYTVFESDGATAIARTVPFFPPVRSGETALHLPALSRLCQIRWVPKYRVCGFSGSITNGAMNAALSA